MANFLVIIDSNSDRRMRYIETIRDKLPPIEGLSINSVEIGDFFAIWAYGKNSYITTALEQTSAAIVFGRPVGDDARDEIAAGKILNLWKKDETRVKAFYNGFYAGLVYDTFTGLTIGADLLGIFPIYYWTYNGVLLAGSSPELFRHHPYFSVEINPHGLVSILLLTHSFGCETLLKGVKRLSAGKLLRFDEGDVCEETQYKIRPSMKHYDLPFSAHVDILSDAIKDTMARHTPANRNYSLLLSGGMDSRMLAGFLREQNVNFDAVTMGIDSDIEMKTAQRVAKSMGIEQSKIEIDYEHYINCAQRQAKWEHISNGFNDIFNWGYCKLLNQNQNLILGHSLDAVIGTRYINWAYSLVEKKMSFESFFVNLNKWGIKAEILEKLFSNNLYSKIVDETIQNIKETFDSFSEIESQKAWCFNLYNRQRFHVGASAFAMSLEAMPIMPAIDRKLLECAGAIPAASIAERRAQMEILCSRFPKLARLPIDRNSYDTTPLMPRVRYLALQEINKKLRKIFKKSKNGKIEHRYYYRIYDFDNEGWKAVRNKAEPYRKMVYDIFNKDEFNAILPKPQEQANLREEIADASGLKLMTGLMLWSKGNL
jgi:asparagine synthase (glutamine-hydrolysing)